LNQAQQKMRRILGDPEAALAERERTRTKVLAFSQALDQFLCDYHSRGGTRYYETITSHRGSASEIVP